MNKNTLNEAIREAERFVKIAKACRASAETGHGVGSYEWQHFQPKDSGATKRSSMDLTRALANLRKPG